MSRKPTKKPPAKKRKSTRSKPLVSQDTQRDIVALILLGVALLTVLTLLFPAGEVGRWWRDLVSRAFGWGWPLVVAAVGTLAIYWLRQRFDERFAFPVVGAAGTALLLSAVLGMLHVLATLSGNVQELPADNGGGGMIGLAIGGPVARLFGRGAGFGALLATAAVGAILALGLTLRELIETAKDVQAALNDFVNRNVSPLFNDPAIRRNGQPPLIDLTGPPPADTRPAAIAPPRTYPALNPGRPMTATAMQPGLPLTAAPGDIQAPPTTIRREWPLPPLDFLEVQGEQELSQSDIRRRVKVIEETLANFHIDARVVEVNQGPAVTQFGVQPAAGVTVNRIVARQNDLSLALAAAPIRIEAPVPGRSIVGIEVPNASIATVGLRSVIESTSFQKIHAKAKLTVALGQDVSGGPVSADLGKMPHLLIAGATGSGKSVCINACIACLLTYNTPDDLKLIMVDPKMVELVAFNGIPHLLAPVVTEIEKVVNVLKWATREMERRYKLFSSHGARNLEMYNKGVTAKSGREYLPYVVIIIDELADIIMVSPDEVERLLCRLAQMARATGIHLIIATQRPSVDVITGLIKANFPARISFAVTSQIDSRVVLDMPGAEKLLGRGDMLYMPSDSSSPTRLQGVWVSEKEMEYLINFWRNAAPPVSAAGPDFAQTISSPIDGPSASESDEDPLLEEAKRVIQQAGHASVSLLQRKLRIGYARAGHLIDTLEQQAFIGPPVDGGRTRDVYGEQGPAVQPPSPAGTRR